MHVVDETSRFNLCSIIDISFYSSEAKRSLSICEKFYLLNYITEMNKYLLQNIFVCLKLVS